MSDFLTRLAQRQLGQMASVEPRLPGLFAPVAAATPLPITEEVLAEKSEAPRTASATPDVMTSPSATDSPAAVSGRHGETTRKLNPARQFATKSDEETFARGADVTFNTEVPALVTPTRSVQGHAMHLPLPPESAATKPAPLPVGQETRGSQKFSQRDAPPRLIDARATTPVAAPPRLERAMPARGEVVALEREHADSEPPVHVTIGRIEVTAVTAAPAPRRAAIARKPAMSLDDYLARRQRRET